MAQVAEPGGEVNGISFPLFLWMKQQHRIYARHSNCSQCSFSAFNRTWPCCFKIKCSNGKGHSLGRGKWRWAFIKVLGPELWQGYLLKKTQPTRSMWWEIIYHHLLYTINNAKRFTCHLIKPRWVLAVPLLSPENEHKERKNLWTSKHSVTLVWSWHCPGKCLLLCL